MLTLFDPFNDRTARDIRNALSAALVSQLSNKSAPSFVHVAHGWLSDVEAEIYRAYIQECQKRYNSVIATVENQQICETRFQAVVLWNAALFFEMHELLETVWHGCKGSERKALKGLIQAAGVCVHRRRNNLKAAGGLARRARGNIQAAPIYLQFIRNIDQLIEHLGNPQVPPPKLQPDNAWKRPKSQ